MTCVIRVILVHCSLNEVVITLEFVLLGPGVLIVTYNIFADDGHAQARGGAGGGACTVVVTLEIEDGRGGRARNRGP